MGKNKRAKPEDWLIDESIVRILQDLGVWFVSVARVLYIIMLLPKHSQFPSTVVHGPASVDHDRVVSGATRATRSRKAKPRIQLRSSMVHVLEAVIS